MTAAVNLETTNLETIANAYQRAMKVLPDSIDTRTKRQLAIGNLVAASERGIQDEDVLADGVIAAVASYQQSIVGRCVHGLLDRLRRMLAPPDGPRSSEEEHQPSCFGLEEERGEGWKGSGAMGPAINEARPSL